MADRRIIYPQKVLTDLDLSQNDILNVRDISNDDHLIKVKSDKGINVDSNTEVVINSNNRVEITSGDFEESINQNSGIDLGVNVSNKESHLRIKKEYSESEVTSKVDIDSPSITLTGAESNITSSTTSVSGDNLNLTSNDIKVGKIDDSTPGSSIEIKGTNGLNISSKYKPNPEIPLTRSLVSSNYVEVKEELFSDNIRVYWDTARNSLVFEKK